MSYLPSVEGCQRIRLWAGPVLRPGKKSSYFGIGSVSRLPPLPSLRRAWNVVAMLYVGTRTFKTREAFTMWRHAFITLLATLALGCSPEAVTKVENPPVQIVNDSTPAAPGYIVVKFGEPPAVVNAGDRFAVPILADSKQAGSIILGAITLSLNSVTLQVDSVAHCGAGWYCVSNGAKLSALTTKGASDTIAVAYLSAPSAVYGAQAFIDVERVGDIFGVDLIDRVYLSALNVWVH